MATILWIIAAVLVIAGIVQLLQGQVALGIVLIVVGLLVGPGGVSIFATSTTLGLVGLWPTSRALVSAPRPERNGLPPGTAGPADPAGA
jgi:hypothetical protein